MKRMTHITQNSIALTFSLMLLVGGLSTARAQQTQQGNPSHADSAGVNVMEDCPMMQTMMQDSEMMRKMKEACPMMTDDTMKDRAAMREMMKNCPMMKEMMGQMMEDCPMMKGSMMQHMTRDGAEDDSDAEHKTAVQADSVQTATITVGASSFEPQRITLEAGIPARLVFTRTTDATCAKQVQIPDFDVQKTDLPLNEPVTITFTPEEAGTFTFACGMNMMKGTLVVTGAAN